MRYTSVSRPRHVVEYAARAARQVRRGDLDVLAAAGARHLVGRSEEVTAGQTEIRPGTGRAGKSRRRVPAKSTILRTRTR